MTPQQQAAFDKAIAKGIAQEEAKLVKRRAKNPPAKPIRNPTTEQLERSLECSVGYDSHLTFRKSVIIGGKQYVVTAASYSSTRANSDVGSRFCDLRLSFLPYRQERTEFYLHELLPPWTTDPKLLDDRRRKIVTREGTTERYALGKLVYYRNRKFHPKPLDW